MDVVVAVETGGLRFGLYACDARCVYFRDVRRTGIRLDGEIR